MAKNYPEQPLPFSKNNADDTLVLLQRIAQKDASALETLYDSFSGMLMSVILPIIKNQVEAEETLQDSFITIWNKAEMYRPHLGQPKSWMVTVAKNKAYDKYRKLVRKSEGLKDLHESVAHQSVSQPLPKDNEALEGCLMKLNLDQRTAVNLVFYQGLTQQEASDKLDTPLGTIKARIRRGLIQLKQCLSIC